MSLAAVVVFENLREWPNIMWLIVWSPVRHDWHIIGATQTNSIVSRDKLQIWVKLGTRVRSRQERCFWQQALSWSRMQRIMHQGVVRHACMYVGHVRCMLSLEAWHVALQQALQSTPAHGHLAHAGIQA